MAVDGQLATMATTLKNPNFNFSIKACSSRGLDPLSWPGPGYRPGNKPNGQLDQPGAEWRHSRPSSLNSTRTVPGETRISLLMVTWHLPWDCAHLLTAGARPNLTISIVRVHGHPWRGAARLPPPRRGALGVVDNQLAAGTGQWLVAVRHRVVQHLLGVDRCVQHRR